MKRKLGILSFILVLFVSVFITGCSSSAETADESNGSDSKSGGDEKITISFIHNTPKAEINQAEGKAFYAQLEQFKKDHPNVVVKDEGYTSDDYRTKIKTLAAANELPDVYLLEGSFLPNFSENGLIEPLNDTIENKADWTENFMNDAFADMTYNGNIYGIPSDMKATSLIFYNEDIFKEAGVKEFPKTWADFKDAIIKIKDAGYTPIALGNKDKWVLQSCFLSTFGDRFTGSDWFYSARDGEGAKFTDPEFVNALEEVKTLTEMGAFNTDMNSINNSAQRTMFYNKKAAMFFEGAWAVSAVVNDAPEDVLASTHLALLPAVEGGNGNANAVSGGTSYGYTINPKLSDEKNELVLELIEALTGKGYAETLKENSGFPVYVTEEFDNSKLPKLTQEYFELTEKSNFTPVYDMKLSPTPVDAINTGLQEITIGVKTPEQVAEEIQDALESDQ
ncbi:ABC transporter substrate-binding protein [Aquibacillus albus]|uniref:Raffinose/stachyose/melibiose transport system substrate-binding protein n=1 Tax=Aquibacillus albus TaxID=1168171 RepID=A0ABS2N4F3_9BACI|nr:extracellular solute-binding protein [Aquibacillus albus]MBM7573002.1 raffinose/stachyose/melibiose transport system substrate-binding protein [Aquibacillus albus]